jgi:hypothetical protein
VTVPNEVSLGEVARTLERVEAAHKSEIQRVEREHRADIERVEREHAEDVRKLREDVINPGLTRVTALETVNANRPTMTFGKWMQALGIVMAFLTVVIAAWVATKGAK